MKKLPLHTQALIKAKVITQHFPVIPAQQHLTLPIHLHKTSTRNFPKKHQL